MAELFPDGEARKQRLMEIARVSDTADLPGTRDHAMEKSHRRHVPIPETAKRRTPPAPPLPASLLMMAIGVATVLTVAVLNWLRQ